MSRKVDTTLSDVMYDAVRVLAREDARGVGGTGGVASEIRKSVRQRLSQYRFPVDIIDMSDREYAQWKAEHPQGIAGERKAK